MTRLLFATLLVLATLLPQGTHDYTAFTPVQVAPGIYSYVSAECTPAGLVSGNITAVIGEESVLVVDSGHFPLATRQIIAHLKSVTAKPVRFLVNTHWHQDHIMGNAEFRDAWPDVAILAHPFTAQELAKPAQGSEYAENMGKNLPPGLETLRTMLASGKKRDGSDMTPEEKESAEELFAAFTAGLEQARQMRFVPANLQVRDGTEISLGGRTARLLWLGIGNTEGDLVVHIPEASVLITGDLVVYPTPFALDSQLLPWSETLDKLAAIDAARIVPGHGPVMENKDYIFAVRDLLRSVARQVEAAKAAGKTKEEALAGLDVTSFRAAYVTTRMREGSFARWFLRPIINNSYKPAAAQ